MDSTKSHHIRAISFCLGIIAATLTNNILGFIFIWCSIAFIIFTQGHFNTYAKFMIILLTPIITTLFILFLFYYMFELKENPINWSILANQHLLPLLRLISIVSLSHLITITLDNQEKIVFLKSLHLPNNFIIIISSAITLWPLMQQKIDDVITARIARGVLKKRSFLSKISQFPYTIRTLLAFSLITAYNRSAIWSQENTLYRLSLYQENSKSKFDHKVWGSFILTTCWLTFSIAVL